MKKPQRSNLSPPFIAKIMVLSSILVLFRSTKNWSSWVTWSTSTRWLLPMRRIPTPRACSWPAPCRTPKLCLYPQERWLLPSEGSVLVGSGGDRVTVSGCGCRGYLQWVDDRIQPGATGIAPPHEMLGGGGRAECHSNNLSHTIHSQSNSFHKEIVIWWDRNQLETTSFMDEVQYVTQHVARDPLSVGIREKVLLGEKAGRIAQRRRNPVESQKGKNMRGALRCISELNSSNGSGFWIRGFPHRRIGIGIGTTWSCLEPHVSDEHDAPIEHTISPKHLFVRSQHPKPPSPIDFHDSIQVRCGEDSPLCSASNFSLPNGLTPKTHRERPCRGGG